MSLSLKLPVIDFASPDRHLISKLIRQACVEHGFFYLVNHGLEEELFTRVIDGTREFFSLPLEEKMKLARKEHRGYTPLYAELLDPSSVSKGDSKESYYIGPLEDDTTQLLNQWPAEEVLPSWRPKMESYYWKVLAVGRRLLSLVALGLNLEEDFFDKSALDKPNAFLRLLHYPAISVPSDEEIYGSSAHSDYGLLTFLVTNGVRGLQVCRDKDRKPRLWEDVPHVNGAFIVNIGDLMERWTNCLFRSTLHRVMPVGQERYSVAFFLEPYKDCVVDCFPGCCSESNPPRYPPIRAGDYLKERLKLTYKDSDDLKSI